MQKLSTSDTMNVVLPAIPMISNRTGAEPQQVTARRAPSAIVYLTSQSVPAGVPRNSFTISTGVNFFQNVSRLSFIGCAFENYYTPNVNPRNNTLTFFSSVSGTTHTVTIPEGLYTSATVLMTAIITAMNTVSGASGQVYSTTGEIALFPRSFPLTASAGTYRFDLTCTALTKGSICYNFPRSQVLTATKTVGSMSLHYTLYIDIVSDTLTRYSKLKSITSGGRGSIFARTYMDAGQWGSTFYGATELEQFSFTYNPSVSVATVDIQLFDSHGDLLYIPDDKNDTMIFEMNVHTEL